MEARMKWMSLFEESPTAICQKIAEWQRASLQNKQMSQNKGDDNSGLVF
jgi:hypothetical protein